MSKRSFLEEAIHLAKVSTEERILRSVARNIVHFQGKPGAHPEHILNGILADLHEEEESVERHTRIRALLKEAYGD